MSVDELAINTSSGSDSSSSSNKVNVDNVHNPNGLVLLFFIFLFGLSVCNWWFVDWAPYS